MLNNIQFHLGKDFVKPTLDSAISFKPIVLLVLNVLTLGMYGSVETVRKQFQAKKLSGVQQDLLQQVDNLNDDWKKIEGKLLQRQNDYHDGNLSTYDLDALSGEVDQLKATHIVEKDPKTSAIAQFVRAIFSFIGQLALNLATAGLFGVYKNHVLGNQVTLLKAENKYLVEQGQRDHQATADKISSQIELLQHLKEFEDSDEGKLQANLKKAQQAAKTAEDLLKEEQQKLQALKTEKTVMEATHLNAIRLKDAELANARQQPQQWGNTGAWGGGIPKGPQAAQPAETEVAKLHKELGPIAPRYTKREEDKNVPGAASLPADTTGLDPEWVEFAKAYNKRYGSKRVAADVIKVGCEHVFESFLKMAEKDGKFHFNRALPHKITQLVVNAEIIYDLLKGGEVRENCFKKYELVINKDADLPALKMVPSEPEKVLEFIDDGKGKKTPKVVTHFRRHDEFFPAEDQSKTEEPNPVDPVSAKWILAQLTKEENEHLLNLLRSPLIENDQPSLQATTEYMKNVDKSVDPARIKLVDTAYRLIWAMGESLDIRFDFSTLSSLWADFADDFDAEAFIKVEDVRPNVENVVVEPAKSSSVKVIDTSGFVDIVSHVNDPHKIIPWEIDDEIVSAKNKQPEFLKLVKEAREKYAVVFKHLDKDIFVKTERANRQIPQLQGTQLNEQYHISHKVLTPGCMYSNLLAILMCDSTQITDANINKLKKAMAAYLDKLKGFEETVQALQSDELGEMEDFGQIAELTDWVYLKEMFAGTIQQEYKCTLEEYQGWLRGDPGAKYIDYTTLTPFEFQLAGYALGIKIGAFNISTGHPADVDGVGRILPQAVYGPNTQECLLMGGTGTYSTFYGLFPKIDLAKARNKGVPEAEVQIMKQLNDYWSAIAPTQFGGYGGYGY